MWYSFLLMVGPLLTGFSVAWCIKPEAVKTMLAGITPRICSNPSEAIMCGAMVFAVLLFWPWKKDNRIYFRDIKEECYDYSKRRNLCIIEFRECCEANCPKMKGGTDV